MDLPDDLNFDAPDDTAYATLERVREGGVLIVSLAMTRLNEARTALEEGRFVDALRHVQEAEAKLTPLATAEGSLATFAGRTRIVRAGEIEVGTSVLNWGVVEKVERRRVDHASGRVHENVILHCGELDGPNELPAEREVYVMAEGEGHDGAAGE